jgi:cyclase
VTSVDREGTRKGFDVDLIRDIAVAVPVPVISSGGMGKALDAVAAVREGTADAIAMADILHYKRATLADIRTTLICNSIAVRQP